MIDDRLSIARIETKRNTNKLRIHHLNPHDQSETPVMRHIVKFEKWKLPPVNLMSIKSYTKRKRTRFETEITQAEEKAAIMSKC